MDSISSEKRIVPRSQVGGLAVADVSSGSWKPQLTVVAPIRRRSTHSVLMLVAALALCGGLERTLRAEVRHPIAIGTFIQWYLVKDWTDARWQSEFRNLKAAGMTIVVLEPTVDSQAHVAYYPTTMPGYTLAAGYGDIVDACLRNAQNAGIQVFLGLNFNDDWWRKGASDPSWLDAQMDVGNAAATELYRKYFHHYNRAFRGWYWAWEVDNLNFQTDKQQSVLAAALDRNVRYLHKLTPHLPVMFCPFMNSKVGTPEVYAAMWRNVFSHTSLGRGDIFCPQDCVGAGGLRLEEVPAWFRALGKCVASVPGLRFWSDTETFDQADWSSAPLSRFVAQLKAVQPYVEHSLTFAYSHYYSPNIANGGYHRSYLNYIRAGALDSHPPNAPTQLTSRRLPSGAIELSWTPPLDGAGICGYIVFRNAMRIGRIPAGTAAVRSPRLTFADNAPQRQPTSYTVQTFDFVGNLSAGAETTAP